MLAAQRNAAHNAGQRQQPKHRQTRIRYDVKRSVWSKSRRKQEQHNRTCQKRQHEDAAHAVPGSDSRQNPEAILKSFPLRGCGLWLISCHYGFLQGGLWLHYSCPNLLSFPYVTWARRCAGASSPDRTLELAPRE